MNTSNVSNNNNENEQLQLLREEKKQLKNENLKLNQEKDDYYEKLQSVEIERDTLSDDLDNARKQIETL